RGANSARFPARATALALRTGPDTAPDDPPWRVHGRRATTAGARPPRPRRLATCRCPVVLHGGSMKYVVRASELNLRSSPRVVSTNRIGLLPRGHEVDLLEKAAAPWWKIRTRLDGTPVEGYVSSDRKS